MGLYVVSRVHSSVQTHSRWVKKWQHLHILKVQAHLDVRKRIEIFLEYLKDSAKIEVP